MFSFGNLLKPFMPPVISMPVPFPFPNFGNFNGALQSQNQQKYDAYKQGLLDGFREGSRGEGEDCDRTHGGGNRHQQDARWGHGEDRCSGGGSGSGYDGGYGNESGSQNDGFNGYSNRHREFANQGPQGNQRGHSDSHGFGNNGGWNNYGSQGNYGAGESCDVGGGRAPSHYGSQLTGSMVGDRGVVKTSGGYTVNVSAGNPGEGGVVEIVSPDGTKTTHKGDPHIDVNGNQVLDYGDGINVKLPDGTDVEVKTQKLSNGTSVIDGVHIIDGDRGIKMTGLNSKGVAPFNMERGNGRELDRQSLDGVSLYYNQGGNHAYTTNNGFGGVDHKPTQVELNDMQAQYASSHHRRVEITAR